MTAEVPLVLVSNRGPATFQDGEPRRGGGGLVTSVYSDDKDFLRAVVLGVFASAAAVWRKLELALGGEVTAERLEILRWMLFDNHKFTSYFATYRFNKSFVPTPPDPAWISTFCPFFVVVQQGSQYTLGR